MAAQLDLALEARHLARFNRNFRSWRNLSFPSPIFPLVAPDVLVETFEQVTRLAVIASVGYQKP